MKLINHQSHLDALPASSLKSHITVRFGQLSEDSDVPPNIFLLHRSDNPKSSELIFLGSAGMCSDLFETHQPGYPEFTSVFEWISYLPDLKVFEMLYLEADLGYLLIVPVELVETHPDLKAVIDSQDPSDPQPLY
jgi:hypothetical protein